MQHCFRFLWLLLPILCFAQPQRPDTLWTKVIGDTTANDWGMDVRQAADGGFVVLIRGDGASNPGRVIKLSADGTTEWEHVTRFSGYNLTTWKIIAMPDQSFIYTGLDACGTTTVKLSSSGTRLWTSCFPGTASIYFRFVIACEDGGCLVITDTVDPQNSVTLIRYSGDGELLWSRVYNYDNMGRPVSVLRTADNGFAMLVLQNYETSIFRVNRAGDSLWTHSFNLGTSGHGSDFCLTENGGFAVTGNHQIHEQPAQFGYFIALLDSAARLQSIRTAPSSVHTEYVYSVAPAEGGGYYLAGSINVDWHNSTDFWLARVDAEADTLWSWVYTTPSDDRFLAVQPAREGGCIATGLGPIDQNSTDAFVVRIQPSQISSAEPRVLLPEVALTGNYPNPFNALTTLQFTLGKQSPVRLAVYDLAGRKVTTLVDQTLEVGSHSIRFDGGNLPSGVYFARLEANGISRISKMVLLK